MEGGCNPQGCTCRGVRWEPAEMGQCVLPHNPEHRDLEQRSSSPAPTRIVLRAISCCPPPCWVISRRKRTAWRRPGGPTPTAAFKPRGSRWSAFPALQTLGSFLPQVSHHGPASGPPLPTRPPSSVEGLSSGDTRAGVGAGDHLSGAASALWPEDPAWARPPTPIITLSLKTI